MERIVDMVRDGHFVDVAAGIEGITAETCRHWLREGRRAVRALDEKGIPIPDNRLMWAEFSTEVRRAMAESKRTMLDIVRDIATQPDDLKVAFQAAKFRLAISDPRFTERYRQELSGPGGGPIEVSGSVGSAITAALKAVPEFIPDDEGDGDE
jgi:hypothetical protein